MNQCACCGKDTTNPKYCSRSCAAKETNRTPKRKRKIRYCSDCGVELSYTQRLKCSPCLAPKDMTLLEAMYTKHHKSSAFALVRSRARKILEVKPKVCQNCGYDKHVEVCHVKPVSSFSLDTLVSTINSEDNLAILCPNCHWEFDKGRLALSS